MPMQSTAALLIALASQALDGLNSVDTRTLDAFAAHGLATITFASTGDPATDRQAVERINGELCLLDQLDLTLPVTVRPSDDNATLAAAADSLHHLATLLDRAHRDADQDQPRQMDRETALKFAENVLSSVG
ncbi:hypothetical protein ABR738_00695 [Streptomyces sp. Edi4]|uniref:hypothetical protein n=1 Tax=Streptomyces sp. Edi4 TaxID=3162527 RepID=UPI0033057400